MWKISPPYRGDIWKIFRLLPCWQEIMLKHGTKKVDIIPLLKESDFVSIHVRENPQTFHLLGEKEFALMKPSSYLINTARGTVIDEGALNRALKEKAIAGAAIDVYEEEPLKPNNSLLKLDNLTITPHIAAESDKMHIRSSRMVAATLRTFLKGEALSPAEIVDLKPIDQKQ